MREPRGDMLRNRAPGKPTQAMRPCRRQGQLGSQTHHHQLCEAVQEEDCGAGRGGGPGDEVAGGRLCGGGETRSRETAAGPAKQALTPKRSHGDHSDRQADEEADVAGDAIHGDAGGRGADGSNGRCLPALHVLDVELGLVRRVGVHTRVELFREALRGRVPWARAGRGLGAVGRRRRPSAHAAGFERETVAGGWQDRSKTRKLRRSGRELTTVSLTPVEMTMPMITLRSRIRRKPISTYCESAANSGRSQSWCSRRARAPGRAKAASAMRPPRARSRNPKRCLARGAEPGCLTLSRRGRFLTSTRGGSLSSA